MSISAFLRGVSSRSLIVGLSISSTTIALAQTSLPPVVVTAPNERAAPKPAARKPIAVRAAAARRIRAAGAPNVTPQPASAASSQSGQTPSAGQTPPTLARWSPNTPSGGPAFVQRFQLPNPSVASITRGQIAEKVNIIDTEDAIKYFPSLFVRKRNDGDTQAVLATRTWGVNSSARSLVYADDVLLTALIGNDNTIGAPRWGMVAPEEIERVDFLYGPFAAAYPGNSMGGVLQITTRMPDKLEMTAKETISIQGFNQWGTNKTYLTSITNASAGDRINDFSWFVSGNFMSNRTQPLTYTTTNNLFPWPGMVIAPNKIGTPANVLGALGALDQQQVNAKLKLAYDFTPTVRATWQTGFWSNDSSTQPQNFIGWYGTRTGTTSLGTSVLQSFGGGFYRVQEQMLTNAASIKSATNGIFDFEVSAANFTYLKSDQISPYSALPPWGYTPNGRDARYGGTFWNLADAKGIWRPEYYGQHEVSFGVHADQYHLNNPTWLTSNWTSGMSSYIPTAAITIAQGSTFTQALWAQDAWRFHPDFKLTLGGRWENWQARDGYNQQLAGLNALGTGWTVNAANLSADMPIYQPALHHTRFSPKASLQWTPDETWKATASFGMANRFPTVRELYNLSTLNAATGVAANPNPNLLPEVALTTELALERKFGADGSARLSLFNENVRDAIISQNTYVSGSTTPVNTVLNVTRVRNRGFEFAVRKDNLLIEGFEATGSVTFVDSRILQDNAWIPGFSGTVANNDTWDLSPVGKNAPYVPKWRWTLTGVYRPDDHWSFTAAARWQDYMWSTISNNDIFRGVYGSFDRFFVVDAKISYKLNDKATFAFGVDNLNNNKYFLFHPFPQRTFTMSGKFQLGSKSFDDIGIFKPARADQGLLGLASAEFARM